MISFKPKQVTKKLLSILSERVQDVLIKRYGLGANGETFTLEAIGQVYGITRERVRQIENYGISSIQKSAVYKEQNNLLTELHKALVSLGGGIMAEQTLLDTLTNDESTRNHLYFLLTVGEAFYRSKENPLFTSRWFTEKKTAEIIERALRNVYQSLDKDDLVTEPDILARFRAELKEVAQTDDDEILKRWLHISKQIAHNPLGDWGPADSSNIKVKGIRDYAYLTVKRHGSPMHFKEVAIVIKELFGHDAHIATTHNELIKDNRFVLVGRGLYALTEWGYTAGVVKEVLRQILEKEGPLTKQEIIDRVRKERYVKDNTIVVNLQDNNLFRKLANGAYTISE